LLVHRPDLLTHNGINNVYRNIVHVLYNSSAKTVSFKPKAAHVKYWWDGTLNDAKKESIKCHREWISAGKPKVGNFLSAKNAARSKYRKFIHSKKQESSKSVSNKLQNSLLQTNGKKFWRLWKSNFKSSNNRCGQNVNDLKDDKSIANYLAENFRLACTPNDKDKDNQFRKRYFDKKSSSGSDVAFLFNAEIVNLAMNKLSDNKAPGHDYIKIEHIKHSHPSTVLILAKLFDILLYTGFIPDDFGVGLTTPLSQIQR